MKNKILLLCFTLMLTNLLYAADTTGLKSYKRLYVGASFTGNVSYRYLTHNYYETGNSPSGLTQEQSQKFLIDYRNKQERPEWGYQVGARVGVRVTRWLSIETGLDYTRNRYSYKSGVLQFGSQWNGGSYNPLVDSSLMGYSIKVIDNYHYLGIPLALNFTMGKRKLKGLVTMGANFNFLTDKTSTVRTYRNGDLVRSSTNPDRQAFNRYNIAPFLGVGMEWHMTKFLFLRIMPMAQMQAMKNIDTPITEYLWSAGMNASLYFGFVRVK